MDNIFYKKLIEDTAYLQLHLNTANQKIKQLKKQLNEMQASNMASLDAPQEISQEIPFVSNKYSTNSTPRTKRTEEKPKKPSRNRQFDPFGQEIPQIGNPTSPYEGITDPDELYSIYQRLMQEWLERYVRLYGWSPWLEAWLARELGQLGSSGELGINILNAIRQWIWHEFMHQPGHESFPGLYGRSWEWDPILHKWIWYSGGEPPVPSPDEWLQQNPPPKGPPRGTGGDDVPVTPQRPQIPSAPIDPPWLIQNPESKL
jgi:hypothetical protein